jgi:hypothetical protein
MQHVLVRPGRRLGRAQIVAVAVFITGKSDAECDASITFDPFSDGRQRNDCRAPIIA